MDLMNYAMFHWLQSTLQSSTTQPNADIDWGLIWHDAMSPLVSEYEAGQETNSPLVKAACSILEKYKKWKEAIQLETYHHHHGHHYMMDTDCLYSTQYLQYPSSMPSAGMKDKSIDKALVALAEKTVISLFQKQEFKTLVAQFLTSPLAQELGKRSHVWRELVQTERVYFKNLVLLYEVYYKPLLMRCHPKSSVGPKILSIKQLNKIFQNIDEIKQITKDLWKSLEKTMDDWPDATPRIGLLFSNHMDKIQTQYSIYIRGLSSAYKQLASFKKSTPSFAEYLQSKTLDFSFSNDPIMHLSCFLILPLQQFQRYKAYLNLILTFTSRDHIDYADLVKVNATLQVLGQSLVEAEHHALLMQKSEQINNIVGYSVRDASILLTNHLFSDKVKRAFVREGPLMGISEFRVRHLYLYLFTDSIVLMLIDQTNEGKYFEDILLLGCDTQVSEISRKKMLSTVHVGLSLHFFSITLERRSWIFGATSSAEKRSWMIDIAKSVQLANERRSILAKNVVSNEKTTRSHGAVTFAERLSQPYHNQIADDLLQSVNSFSMMSLPATLNAKSLVISQKNATTSSYTITSDTIPSHNSTLSASSNVDGDLNTQKTFSSSHVVDCLSPSSSQSCLLSSDGGLFSPEDNNYCLYKSTFLDDQNTNFNHPMSQRRFGWHLTYALKLQHNGKDPSDFLNLAPSDLYLLEPSPHPSKLKLKRSDTCTRKRVKSIQKGVKSLGLKYQETSTMHRRLLIGPSLPARFNSTMSIKSDTTSNGSSNIGHTKQLAAFHWINVSKDEVIQSPLEAKDVTGSYGLMSIDEYASIGVLVDSHHRPATLLDANNRLVVSSRTRDSSNMINVSQYAVQSFFSQFKWPIRGDHKVNIQDMACEMLERFGHIQESLVNNKNHWQVDPISILSGMLVRVENNISTSSNQKEDVSQLQSHLTRLNADEEELWNHQELAICSSNNSKPLLLSNTMPDSFLSINDHQPYQPISSSSPPATAPTTHLFISSNPSRMWCFVGLSVGRCKAFYYSPKRAKCIEIGHYIDHPQPPSGALGACFYRETPDLRNMDVIWRICDEHDLFVVCTETFYNQLDPELLGIQPCQISLQKQPSFSPPVFGLSSTNPLIVNNPRSKDSQGQGDLENKAYSISDPLIHVQGSSSKWINPKERIANKSVPPDSSQPLIIMETVEEVKNATWSQLDPSLALALKRTFRTDWISRVICPIDLSNRLQTRQRSFAKHVCNALMKRFTKLVRKAMYSTNATTGTTQRNQQIQQALGLVFHVLPTS